MKHRREGGEKYVFVLFFGFLSVITYNNNAVAIPPSLGLHACWEEEEDE